MRYSREVLNLKEITMKFRKKSAARVVVKVHAKDGALNVDTAKARMEAFAEKTKACFLASLSLQQDSGTCETGGVLAGKTKRTGATVGNKSLSPAPGKLKTGRST